MSLFEPCEQMIPQYLQGDGNYHFEPCGGPVSWTKTTTYDLMSDTYRMFICLKCGNATFKKEKRNE